MPFAWSAPALDHLHRLYVLERRSASDVARALGGGLTRNAVLGKAQRLGWSRPPQPGRPKAEAASEAARPRLVAANPATPMRRAPFSGRIPLPPLREIAVIGQPRLWTERKAGECAFPVGEPARPDLQASCCAPVQRRGAYCAAHRRLMTLPDTAMTAQEEEVIVDIARRAA